MIHPGQLRDEVIVPVLRDMNMFSPAAVNLMLLTAATESGMGYYLVQLKGPAKGIYQMEPETHHSLWDTYLSFKPVIAAKIKRYGTCAGQLVGSLNYATAMARLKYWRRPEPLPAAADLIGLARYYKQFFNTFEGSGSVIKAVQDCEDYCLSYFLEEDPE